MEETYGTVVFPDANVKIFLDAELEERVRRRHKQNIEKGINMTIEEVRENLAFRDNNDANSDVSPCVQAEDAIYIDTTNLTIDEVVKKVSDIIDKKKMK